MRRKGVLTMSKYYVTGTEIEGRILLKRDNGYITTYDNLSDAQAKAEEGLGWTVYKLEKVEVNSKEEDGKPVEKKDEKTIKIEGVIKDLFENYKNMMIHTEDNDKVGLEIDLNNYRKFVNRLEEINKGKR